MERKTASADELDRLFDEGDDGIDQYLDWGSATRPDAMGNDDVIHVDLPAWMRPEISAAATQAGVSAQTLIEEWIAARLQDVSKAA